MSVDDDSKQPKPKSIVDIEKPEDAKPSSTSKPVIVGNRPVLKDPMMVEDKSSNDDDKPETKNPDHVDLSRSEAKTLQPLSHPDTKDAPEPTPAEDKPEPAAPKPEPEPEKETEPKPAETPEPEKPGPAEDSQTKPTTGAEKKIAAEEAKKAEHDAEIQKLVDEGQYILPISTTEKRQAKHFMILGVVAAVLLVLVWLDLALDASLIHLGGLHPVTHFFSN